MRSFFEELIVSEVPVVFHNALVDLIFLYQSFYTDTPSSLHKFTADLSEVSFSIYNIQCFNAIYHI